MDWSIVWASGWEKKFPVLTSYFDVDVPGDNPEADNKPSCGPEGSKIHHRYLVDVDGVRDRRGQDPTVSHAAVDYQHCRTWGYTSQGKNTGEKPSNYCLKFISWI